ncbi:MAG TPA: hypothetical protein VMH02_02610 [Verrucomicrobiae bacterium]|nr:hypothetical protein [Verrucomicrobiae bacterium]
MNRHDRALGAILCFALLCACSGSGTGAPSSGGVSTLPGAAGTHKTYRTGRIRAHIHIPASKHHRKRGRNGHWLPSATSEIDFTLLSVNGDPSGVNWCNVGQGQGCYNFSIYTQGSNAGGCTSDGNGGWECSVNEPAPAASDNYEIQAQTCPGRINGDGTCAAPDGLQLLSESNTVIDVPLDGVAQGNFTLNPVVASLQWSASDIQVGSGQPYATGAQAPYPTVQIQALDEYGDIIVGATTDPSGGYNTALYLQGDGSADYVVWNCSDPSVTFETGGGPYSNIAGYKPLSLETIANGYTSDQWDGKRGGKRGHWYQNGFNSPESAPQSDSSGGKGVDGNGNAVQAVGNNGIEINYDGSTPLDLYTQFTCNAYDSEGNQASVAITLGNGSIVWTTDAVRAPRR